MNDYIPEEHDEEPVIGDAPPQAKTLFSNKAYDLLKWIAQIFLPALGAAYFSLSELLHLPAGKEVVGVIVIVDTFLGALLKGSSVQYENSGAKYDGAIYLQPSEVEGFTDMNVRLDPVAIDQKKEVVVKIHR